MYQFNQNRPFDLLRYTEIILYGMLVWKTVNALYDTVMCKSHTSVLLNFNVKVAPFSWNEALLKIDSMSPYYCDSATH